MRTSSMLAAGLTLSCMVTGPLSAADAPASSTTIIVTAPGNDLDLDDAIALDTGRIVRDGLPDLAGALGRDIAGLALSQAQANPFQNDLIYRGYAASPLQGRAPGLAVYVDGARFNLPFGETVNLDLLPDAAIAGLSLRDASPVYGLNALGGALVLETQTGRRAPGISGTLAGGDHEQGEADLSAGWRDGAFSAFFAGSARHDGGWRAYSPSTLYNGFADLGWDGATAGIHAKLIAADTDLTGNGAAPIELLAADRSAVFTWPDNTRNRYLRLSLHPWLALGTHSRIEASLSWQKLRQNTVNGDLADIEACEEEDDDGLLCLETADEDEEALLIGTNGAPIPALLDEDEAYGLLNRSNTRSEATGALVQFVDHRPLFGGENRLVLGFSHDAGVTRFASSSELGALTRERSVDGLGPVVAQPDGSVAPVSLRVVTAYSGLFLSDRLPLGEKLTAEIGLRWNAAVIRLEDQIGTALNGRHVFRRLNPGLELDYAVSDGLSLRLGYAEANRAPTPAELSCADEDAPCSLTNFFVGDPPLRQVVAKSWEAGASGRIAGDWSGQWLLSLYRSTNEDDIQFTASDTRGRAYFRNIGETRRQGVEASLSLARGPWSLRLGYALTDATYRTPLTVDSPDNPAADDEGQVHVQPGDRLPAVPRHRAVLGVDYAREGFAFGADLLAQSGTVFVGDEGNDLADTGSFATIGLHGSVRLAGPVRLFARVTNLLDRDHATFGTFSEVNAIDLAEAPGASDPRALSPAAPRRWLVGLHTAF